MVLDVKLLGVACKVIHQRQLSRFKTSADELCHIANSVVTDVRKNVYLQVLVFEVYKTAWCYLNIYE